MEKSNHSLKYASMNTGFMDESEDLEEKKLLGSGGYAFVKITEDEEIKANLGFRKYFWQTLGD